MALKDKLANETGIQGSPCSVARALDGLPPDDLALFVALLGTAEQRGRSAAYIYALMQDERRDLHFAASAANEACDRPEAARLQELALIYNVGLQTINRHRGQTCRCFKDAR